MKKKIILGILALLLTSVGIMIPSENLEQIYCKVAPQDCTGEN